MTGDLLIIVPSRGRPGNVARLLGAVHMNRRLETHVCLAVDDDDESLHDYEDIMQRSGADGDEIITGSRDGLAGWTNQVALLKSADYRYLASFGDDHIPRTRGFDKALCRGIEDMGGTGFTYPWDGLREDVPEAVVMSSDIVQALGWMCEPSLHHYYIDNVWADLGRGAGCLRHLRAVAVDHLNAASGRAPGDATYASASEKLLQDRDAYRSWRKDKAADDIKVVMSLRDRRLQAA